MQLRRSWWVPVTVLSKVFVSPLVYLSSGGVSVIKHFMQPQWVQLSSYLQTLVAFVTYSKGLEGFIKARLTADSLICLDPRRIDLIGIYQSFQESSWCSLASGVSLVHLTYFRQICRLGLSHSCLQASFVAGATCCTVPAQPEPPNHTNTGGPKMSLDPRGDRCQNCVPLAQPGQLQVQFSSNSPGSKNKEHKNAKNTEVHKEYSHLPASRIFKLSTSGVLGETPQSGNHIRV